MFDDVKTALSQMNSQFPRPGIDPLEVSEAYDLTKHWPNEYWPNSELPGVYLFADDKGKTLYIGKSSCKSNVGHRLGAYWKNSPDNKPIPKDPKAEGVRYVATITVPESHAFEVPAIEEWLINHVATPRNKVGT